MIRKMLGRLLVSLELRRLAKRERKIKTGASMNKVYFIFKDKIYYKKVR